MKRSSKNTSPYLGLVVVLSSYAIALGVAYLIFH